MRVPCRAERIEPGANPLKGCGDPSKARNVSRYLPESCLPESKHGLSGTHQRRRVGNEAGGLSPQADMPHVCLRSSPLSPRPLSSRRMPVYTGAEAGEDLGTGRASLLGLSGERTTLTGVSPCGAWRADLSDEAGVIGDSGWLRPRSSSNPSGWTRPEGPKTRRLAGF
jgi:hypothetical protein